MFARGEAGGRISLATNVTNSSISLGGSAGSEPVHILNFNYTSPVTLDNILGGRLYQELKLALSNTSVTIPNNRSTFYLNGVAVTPSNSKSILVFH